jgi:hypothetical protein
VPRVWSQVLKVGFISASFAKKFAIRALHMWSKEMETTAHNIGNVGKLFNNLPATMLQPIRRRLAEWRPMISISLDPLQSTWLASDLHQTLTSSKMSSPGYRHLAPISSTTIAEQTMVQSCDKCLNINGDYV